MPGGQHNAANGFNPRLPGLYVPNGMSFGWPCSTSNPERIIGLAPRCELLSGDVDFRSDPLGVTFPLSDRESLLFTTLISGELALLRDGTRALLLDLSSQTLSLTLLDFDDGRSSERLSTFISYGLNANGLVSCGVVDFGVLTWFDGDFDDSDFLFLSIANNGFTADESAPIWLQVCANKANGLFFESSCNWEKRKKILLIFFFLEKIPKILNFIENFLIFIQFSLRKWTEGFEDDFVLKLTVDGKGAK